MKEWSVPLTVTIWSTAVVDAETASEAREKAMRGEWVDHDINNSELQSWEAQPVSSIREIK